MGHVIGGAGWIWFASSWPTFHNVIRLLNFSTRTLASMQASLAMLSNSILLGIHFRSAYLVLISVQPSTSPPITANTTIIFICCYFRWSSRLLFALRFSLKWSIQWVLATIKHSKKKNLLSTKNDVSFFEAMFYVFFSVLLSGYVNDFSICNISQINMYSNVFSIVYRLHHNIWW